MARDLDAARARDRGDRAGRPARHARQLPPVPDRGPVGRSRARSPGSAGRSSRPRRTARAGSSVRAGSTRRPDPTAGSRSATASSRRTAARAIATEVVHALFDWAQAQGVDRFRASVSPGNVPSLAIITGLGFRRSASRSTTSTARSSSSSSMAGRRRSARPVTRRRPDAMSDMPRCATSRTTPDAPGARGRPGLRHAGRPRRRRTGRADRGGLAADLPDLDLRPGRRRQPARRLRVRALAEPDPRTPRAGDRGARGRRARDRLRVGVGGDRGHRRARRAGRRDRRRRRRLRRDLPLSRARPPRQGRRRALRRPRGRAGRALGGAHRADAAGLVRDAVEPAAQGRRHRGDRGDRRAPGGRGRPTAARRGRQHVRVAGPPAAADDGRGHRLPLGDEVPGRSLRHDRRRGGHLG